MKSPKKLPIESNPEILRGTPVFKGTRVPVQALFEYLEGGDTIDDFLEQYPSVKRQHVLKVLEQSKDQLLALVSEQLRPRSYVLSQEYAHRRK